MNQICFSPVVTIGNPSFLPQESILSPVYIKFDMVECGNRTLTLYPTGNIKDNGADHISLYLKVYDPRS